MTPDDLAALIVHRLHAHGLTSVDVAAICQLDARTVRRWAAGDGLADHASFLSLLEFLGVELRVAGDKVRALGPPGDDLCY